MRFIHVEDGLRLRFPERDIAFSEGVEIGILAANLASGRGEFTVQLSSNTLEQAQTLARQMGYWIHVVRKDDAWAEVTFLTVRKRPKLKLIHTYPEAQTAS